MTKKAARIHVRTTKTTTKEHKLERGIYRLNERNKQGKNVKKQDEEPLEGQKNRKRKKGTRPHITKDLSAIKQDD